MSKTIKPTWTAIRQHLKSWESEALIALIKDLHDSSSVNRDFVAIPNIKSSNPPFPF